MQDTEEIWKDIPGLNGFYRVSNSGKILSIRSELIIRPANIGKYLQAQMNISGVVYKLYVHRAVALAFLPNPYNKPIVNHIDCNGFNNHVGNLEWVTAKENAIHAIKLGTCRIKKPRLYGIIPEEIKLTVIQLSKSKLSNNKIASKLGISRRSVDYIVRIF